MTLRLAVVSDSHLRGATPWFEAVYDRYLAGADLLFHCGDATGLAVWSSLLRHPRFEAVAGNSDDCDLAGQLPQLLERQVFGRRIGVVHGWGPRPGLAERIERAWPDRFDLIFFGHSHAFEDTTIGRTRLVNPGSLRPGGSLALIDLDPDALSVRRVDLPVT